MRSASLKLHNAWRLNATTVALALILIFAIVSFYSSHTIHSSIGDTSNHGRISKEDLLRPSKKDVGSINESLKPIAGTTSSADIDSWLDRVISKAHITLENLEKKVDIGRLVSERVQSSAKSELSSSVKHLKTNHDPTIVASSSVVFNNSSSSSSSSPTVRLHAVTYASHGGRDDRFCRAVESAIRNNIDLVILGWGVKWRGLSQKLEAAESYARSLPPDDIIMFTDAFDVLFAESLDVIKNTFLQETSSSSFPSSSAGSSGSTEGLRSSGSEIIFSAECGCWPHVMEDRDACFNKYPKSPTPYRYLNSGTWIGRAKRSAEMLAQVMKDAGNDFANANDQKLVADMYIAGDFGIKLDFYNKLFQSMHMTLDPPLPRCNPVEDVKLTGGRWLNTRTNSRPAVFHFNGGGKTHHLSMEGKVWYKSPEHNTPEKKAALAAYELNVPTQPGGKMRFDTLCRDYVRTMK